MNEYQAASWCIARAATLPLNEALKAMSTEVTVDVMCAWAEEELFGAALYVASPGIIKSIDQLRSGSSLSAKKIRGLKAAVSKYRVRAASRPTPFGMFAAVGECRIAETEAMPRVVGELAALVRPDIAWEYSEIKNRSSLVRRNDLVREEGNRWVLDSADAGYCGPSVRVRRTEPAEMCMDWAKEPVSKADLLSRLKQSYPDVSEDRFNQMISTLSDNGLLITWPRPSIHGTTPSNRGSWLQIRMDGASPPNGEDARCGDASFTTGVRDKLKRQEDALRDNAQEVSGPVHQVDTAMSVDGIYPHRAAEAVGEAVGALMRLPSSGNDSLTKWRRDFEERLGAGVLVPVTEALSDVLGFGAPHGYRNPAGTSMGTPPASPEGERHSEVVGSFLAEALSSGQTEVELSDDWLNRFGAPSRPPYPTVDVFTELCFDEGRAEDWKVVLNPEAVALGGRTIGRFHDLLPAFQENATEFLQVEEGAREEAIFAELVYLSDTPRSGNVSRRSQLRRFELAINMSRTDGTERISLDDILVGSNGERLFLWSNKYDKEIVITQGHVLNYSAAPNVLRFLIEVSLDGYRMPAMFEWGALDFAPYLPRVCRGRVVLHPAQWTLRKSLLDASLGGDSDERWREAISAWRTVWKVPRYVRIVQGDNRLLMDMDSEGSLEILLQMRAASAQPIRVQEMIPAPGSIGIVGPSGLEHVTEFALTLSAKTPASPSPPQIKSHVGRIRPLTAGTPRESSWAGKRIYAPLDLHDEIIQEHLMPWMESVQELLRESFYIRYADPDPHLRVRIRPIDGELARVSASLTEFVESLMGEGIVRRSADLDYVRELVRYGGIETMELAESVFTVQSQMAPALLSCWKSEAPTLPKHFLPLVCMDIAAVHFGLGLEQRHFLASKLSEGQRADEFSRFRKSVLSLLGECSNGPGDDGSTLRGRIELIMQAHETHGRAFGQKVFHLERQGKLTQTADEVFGSVLHMFFNRLMVSGGEHEQQAVRAWHQGLSTMLAKRQWEESREF